MENTCFVRKHSCKNGWKSFRTNPFLQTFLAVCAQKEKIILEKKNAKHKTSSYNKNIATDSFTSFQTSPLDAK